MKKIICIKGNCDTGKTTTVHRIYEKITGKKCSAGDINEVVIYKGEKIALVSAGDPGQHVFEKVKSYVEGGKVDIIIFCARTKRFENRSTVYEKEIEPHITNGTLLDISYSEYTLYIKYHKDNLDAFLQECDDLVNKIFAIL